MGERRYQLARERVGLGTAFAAGLLAFAGAARGQILVEPVPSFEDVRAFVGNPQFIRPYGMAAANFDGDLGGYPDLVVTLRGFDLGGQGKIAVLVNMGVDENGDWLGFAEDPDRYYVGDPQFQTRPFGIGAANLDPLDDPQGHPDIVVSAFASDEVFVFLNDWTGQFQALPAVNVGSNFAPRGLAIGAFGNSLSTPGVAVASGLDDRVAFLDNDGHGSLSIPFTGVVSLGIFASAYDVIGGEFDVTGAGNEDALTPDWSDTSCNPPFLNDTVSVLRNEGSYVFTVTQESGDCASYPRNYSDLARGRFQGTGENDVAASSECDAFVDVILGDGLGGFTHDCAADRYQVHPTSATQVEGLTTGHVNGGTKADIVAALFDTDEVSVLLGRGNGTLQRPSADSGYLFSTHDPAEPLSVRPVQVIVVDMDQDGFGDIVVANEGSANEGSVSVLINKGFVQFPPP
jgi:hypothetical protein